MRKILRLLGSGLRNGLVALGALAFAGGVIAVADYTATPGVGLTFASLVLSGKHYMANVLCDAVIGETQCAAVKAASTPSPATDTSLSVTLNAGSNGIITTGTAGSPSAQVVSVQGVSGGTGLPANVAAMGGTAINSGCVSNYGTAPSAVACPSGNVYVTNTNSNGSAASASSSPVVIASDQTAADACMFRNKTNLLINQNGTSSVQLIALSGSTTIYVCSISLFAAGATTVAITTGTGTACVTGNAGVFGSTTANIANSVSLLAGGGLTLGNGGGTVMKGAASSELCMILGTNVYVSGNLTYVQI